jgi:peptide/nickel transport system permease protein
VSLVSFLLIFLVHADPAAEIAGPGATSEEVARIRGQLGLDEPIHVQMLAYYGRLLRGDLGHSIMLNRSVTTAIVERAPVTLTLTAMALGLSLVVALLLGVIAAVYRNTWIDQSAMTVALLGLSVPDFWVGLVMIYTFAVLQGWFPTGGYVELSQGLWPWLRAWPCRPSRSASPQLGSPGADHPRDHAEVRTRTTCARRAPRGSPSAW